MKYPMMIAATAIALSVSASASPVTTTTPLVGAGGDVNAIYVFSDAGDLDVSWKNLPPPPVQLFCNHANGPCGVNPTPVGATADLGTIGLNVAMVFQLNDMAPGHNATFLSNAVDSTDGFYHARITQNYSQLGLPPISQTAANAIGNFQGAVWYIGWEDRLSGDYDYNDLVMAVVISQPDRNPGIPEPLTLSLVGMGLLGAFGLRRRNQKA